MKLFFVDCNPFYEEQGSCFSRTLTAVLLFSFLASFHTPLPFEVLFFVLSTVFSLFFNFSWICFSIRCCYQVLVFWLLLFLVWSSLSFLTHAHLLFSFIVHSTELIEDELWVIFYEYFWMTFLEYGLYVPVCIYMDLYMTFCKIILDLWLF